MKKLWKTLSVLSVCAAFGFTAACGPVNTSDSSASDGPTSSASDTTGNSGNSDTTGNSGNSGGGTEGPSAASVGYVQAAFAQLATTKSATITISGTTTNSSTQGGQTMSQTAEAETEIVIAPTDTGLNMKIDATISMPGADGTESDSQTMYIIDGVLYTYDDENDYYLTTAYVDLGFLSAFAGLDLSAEDMGAAVDLIALLLDEFGEVTEENATVTIDYDASLLLNGVITLINGIDESTTTLETALNTVLAFLGTDLTVNDILDTVKPFGAMTLPEAIGALDTCLEEYGTSVQAIKDAVVALGPVSDLLDQAVAAGQIPEALVAVIRTGTVADILTLLEMDEMTVNQLIQMIFADATAPDESFDLAVLIDEQLKPMLKTTTLADVGILLPDFEGFAFSEAELSAELVIGEIIEKMELGVKFDLSQTSVYGGETMTVGMAGDYTLSVEFSDEEATIALPADAVVVYPVWQSWMGYSDEVEECFITFNAAEYSEGKFVGEGNVNLHAPETGSYIIYGFTYEFSAQDSYDELPVTVTVTVTSAYGCNEEGIIGTEYTVAEISELFDGTTTFTVVIYPSVAHISIFGGSVAVELVDLTMFPFPYAAA